MSTADEPLCKGLLRGVGFALVEFWCLLRPPFGFVICGAIWVVPWHGLKLVISVFVQGSVVGELWLQAKVSGCLHSV